MVEKEYRQFKYQRPPGSTEILLVRHGESRPAQADKPFPLVDGQGDPELAANGRQQAIQVGLRLAQLDVAAVYVTKLKRTAETAAPLCQHLGLMPQLEPNLHEVHLGEWEAGILRMKAHQNDPIFLQMQAEERWDAIPGAESTKLLEERVMRGIRNIALANPDKLIAAFVHGGVIGQVLATITESRPFAFNAADNGSISHIVVEGDRIALRRFNDTAHLGSETAGAVQLPT
ncbi:MAG: histidine phosphatase family protein [Gammaproteobacteria bacterium]|jgi:2,3-bisphosphoglycerate-dependent phosphoglycerate mutase|nr:histidine phosphatase family protein [Gammaproteobacteria bacterium]MBT5203245.1 histidine phosphatase family protein [Gammaproteobacteria bacterium]